MLRIRIRDVKIRIWFKHPGSTTLPAATLPVRHIKVIVSPDYNGFKVIALETEQIFKKDLDMKMLKKIIQKKKQYSWTILQF